MTDEDDRAAVLAAAAASALAGIPYGWLTGVGDEGRVAARPVGRLPKAPGDDEWRLRFVTDGRSRKIAELARARDATVIFQRDADDVYLALSGPPTVRPHAAADPRLWRRAFEAYFPSEGDRENAVFLEIAVGRMDLWVRGVTPEPFGQKTTRLERDPTGRWRRVA